MRCSACNYESSLFDFVECPTCGVPSAKSHSGQQFGENDRSNSQLQSNDTGHERPTVGASMNGLVSMNRYANLLTVSNSMRGYGGLLKILGILTAVLGVFGGLNIGGVSGVACALLGGVAGISIHCAGVLVAAFGESMLALADIAQNTTPRPS